MNSPLRWRAFMRSIFRIALRRMSTRHYSMKAGFIASSAPCTALWKYAPKAANAKLRGPVEWTVYHLYVILDVFSPYVVGWIIAHRESSELAKRLIKHSCRAQYRARQTHLPCRSTLLYEIQTRGSVAGRSGRRQNPQPGRMSRTTKDIRTAQFRTLKYRPGLSPATSRKVCNISITA
jgi:transposase InsO family protein